MKNENTEYATTEQIAEMKIGDSFFRPYKKYVGVTAISNLVIVPEKFTIQKIINLKTSKRVHVQSEFNYGCVFVCKH